MSKGNCIDKFISNRIDEKINGLLKHRLNIRRRIDTRENTEDYFNTLCYEQDFSDIIELRNIANDLVVNCNKFLERISEQYSKLN